MLLSFHKKYDHGKKQYEDTDIGDSAMIIFGSKAGDYSDYAVDNKTSQYNDDGSALLLNDRRIIFKSHELTDIVSESGMEIFGTEL